MIAWMIGNIVVASIAAAVVALLCRFNRSRPEVCHSLWLVVFALLVMPPLPISGMPGANLRSIVQERFAEQPGPVVEPVITFERSNLSAVTLPDLPILATTAAVSPIAGGGSDRLPVKSLLIGLAALLTMGFGVRFGRRVRRFHTRVIEAPEASQADPVTASAIAAVAARLDVSTPEVRLIQGIGSPAVWCLGRARLLWPVGPGAPTTVEPAVIAHELAHIARRDTWVARIEPIATALLFWNPLFWLIRQRVHTYAELSCDAWALWAYPDARRAYAEALVGSNERNRTAPLAVRGLCATHPNVKDLERRLTLIMKKQVTRGASKGLLFAAAIGALLVAPGVSQDSPVWKQLGQQHDEAEHAEKGLLEASALLKQAAAKQGQGDIEAAIGLVESALTLDPTNGTAHANAGYMLVGAGQTEAARKHFKTQIKLGYKVPTALYNVACCASLEGDAKGAASSLAAAIRGGFDDAELMSNDADLASLRGSRSFDAAVKLAKILKSQRQSLSSSSGDERLATLMSIAKIASDDGEAYSELGMAYHDRGQYEGSYECFVRQAKLGFEAGRANYNVGCALARLGKNDAAIEALYRSAKLKFSYPNTAADEDLKGLAGHPKFEGAVRALAKRQDFASEVEKMVIDGQYEQALAGLAYVLDDPESDTKALKWAYSVSSDAYEALGDHKAAKEHYAKAKKLAVKAKSEATAYAEFRDQGKAAQLDYSRLEAGVTSAGLAQLMEAELSQILEEAAGHDMKVVVEEAMKANIKESLQASREAAEVSAKLTEIENELALAQASIARQLADLAKQQAELKNEQQALNAKRKALLKKQKKVKGGR